MLTIKLEGLEKVIEGIKQDGKDIQRGVAKAITKTAGNIREEVRNQMTSVFDRPKPFTLNSIYLKGATADNWTAVVWIKDRWTITKGNAAADYLEPQVKGGVRRLKKFEAALKRKGVLPEGWFAVPGSGARFDAYGNVSAGQIVQILTALDSLPGRPTVGGVEQPIRKKNARVKAYFAIRPGKESDISGLGHIPGIGYYKLTGRKSHLAPGVYQRVGTGVKCILIFTNKRPTYRPRLPYFNIAQRVYDQTFNQEFDKAMRGVLTK